MCFSDWSQALLSSYFILGVLNFFFFGVTDAFEDLKKSYALILQKNEHRCIQKRFCALFKLVHNIRDPLRLHAIW